MMGCTAAVAVAVLLAPHGAALRAHAPGRTRHTAARLGYSLQPPCRSAARLRRACVRRASARRQGGARRTGGDCSAELPGDTPCTQSVPSRARAPARSAYPAPAQPARGSARAPGEGLSAHARSDAQRGQGCAGGERAPAV